MSAMVLLLLALDTHRLLSNSKNDLIDIGDTIAIMIDVKTFKKVYLLTDKNAQYFEFLKVAPNIQCTQRNFFFFVTLTVKYL